MFTTSTMFDERDPLADHCGIVAAFSPVDIEFFSRGLAGLSVLQTRGYDGAGFCAQDTSGIITQYKGVGMVKEVFNQSVIHDYEAVRAKCWVYQVRYGTDGKFIAENVQPMIGQHVRSRDTVMVAHNGQFSREPEDTDTTLSDTAKFVQALTKSAGVSWDERIVHTLAQKKGAWSLAIGTKDALYVARDPWGIRPFVYGHLWNDAVGGYMWVAASETGALQAIGVTDPFELLPGTIAKISQNGLEIIDKIHQRKRALCIFENIYIQHGAGKAHLPRTNPRAIKRSPTVDEVRRRSGKILAREAPIERRDVDMVIGVPGTGIEGGMTYARALNLPYFQAITDKADSLDEQRTFMTANIDSIYQKVLDHFCFDDQALANRKIVLVDDSIVRGNITRGLVYLLKTHFHAKSVHVRILSPPIDKACYLGINTRSASELIANQYGGDVEKIRIALAADSLAYISGDGLKEALTGDPKAPGFCMGCMVGYRPPMDAYGKQVPQVKRKREHMPKKILSHTPLPRFVYRREYE